MTQRIPAQQKKLLDFLSSIATCTKTGVQGSTRFIFEGLGEMSLVFSNHKSLGQEGVVYLLFIEADMFSERLNKGTTLMDFLITGSDIFDVPITLTPMRVSSEMRVSRLVRWYKRLGFIRERCQTDMVRYPVDRFDIRS